MTPQEKAWKLFLRYLESLPDAVENDKDTTKQCALIIVDEIEKALTEYGQATDELQNMDREFNYWQEVRKEIEKL